MLLDFAKEYADVSFSQTPICNLDLLVFAQLACFDFPETCRGRTLVQAMTHQRTAVLHMKASASGFDASGFDVCDFDVCDFDEGVFGAITPNAGTSTEGDCGMNNFDASDSAKSEPTCALFNREDGELARIVAQGRRYENVVVRAFVSVHSAGPYAQFAALALECPSAIVVVFRGTDATFLGWRETFGMALDAPVPSQVCAARFLERAHTINARKPIVLCGHSKGGNMAVYAVSTCKDNVAACIASIVSFDGPGMPSHIERSCGYARIEDRITVYIPRASVVGLLFNQPAHVVFIGSRKPGFMQHYPYFWKTSGSALVSSFPSPDAEIAARGVQGLIDKLSSSQKRLLISTIFTVLESSGARSFYELSGNRLRIAANAACMFASNGGEVRHLAAAVIKTYLKAAFKAG